MAKEELDTTPYNEECAQVGTPNYRERAEAECRAFIGQIKRAYPAPEGVRFGVSFTSHDFGAYAQVVMHLDNNDPEQLKYFYLVEADSEGKLAHWDEIAKAQLLR